VLNANFALPDDTAGVGKGALRTDLKAGLRQEEIGGRAARRMTVVDAIERRMGQTVELLTED
jgi:hypothetical protein